MRLDSTQRSTHTAKAPPCAVYEMLWRCREFRISHSPMSHARLTNNDRHSQLYARGSQTNSHVTIGRDAVELALVHIFLILFVYLTFNMNCWTAKSFFGSSRDGFFFSVHFLPDFRLRFRTQLVQGARWNVQNSARGQNVQIFEFQWPTQPGEFRLKILIQFNQQKIVLIFITI